MPMGRGFNLWELVGLWKQVRKLWPVYRQVLRGETQANDPHDGGPHDSGAPGSSPPGQPSRPRRSPDSK